jgi:hypothetical protein
MPVYWTPNAKSTSMSDKELSEWHEKFLLAALERIMRSVTRA